MQFTIGKSFIYLKFKFSNLKNNGLVMLNNFFNKLIKTLVMQFTIGQSFFYFKLIFSHFKNISL